MRPLCATDINRHNHFNLLRMLAAFFVLFSHSYPITRGMGTTEPLSYLIAPYNTGRFAVWIFFIISGFFISASFERSRGLGSYVTARIVRIYPGLLVALSVTVFVIGPAFTLLSIREYFSSTQLLDYIFHNMMLSSFSFPLPGLFSNLPYPHAVNGSLWTLRYEMMCYAIIPVAVYLWRFTFGFLFTAAGFAFLHAALEYWRLHDAGFYTHQLTSRLHELFLPFFWGMVFYRYRTRIPHNAGMFLASAALIVLLREMPFYMEIFVPLLAYMVMYLGFYHAPRLERYNRLGDYSYGTYLYAFPLQQAIIQHNHFIAPLTLMFLAIPLAVMFGVASWHFVEKPALALKLQKLNSLRYFRQRAAHKK